MNRSILLLMAFGLVIGLSTSVYAQTISDNVVINEVDTNPFGDDSMTVAEWVELYNPTDSDVDLSGWEIASTTVLKKTLTIPDGVVISPGKFLTYTYEKIWFTDSNESVELRNSDGIIIDKTPLITDLKNDFSSWQRSYDGYSDWEFSLSSAGGSNGQYVDVVESSPVVVTVSTDKSSYVFGDTLIIQGTVSDKLYVEKPYFQTEPILITISGPNYFQTVSLYPDYNLNYETTLNLFSVLGINEGTYDVIVSYGGTNTPIAFSVGPEIILDDVQSDSVLNVQTEKSEYLPGQSVSITGFTSNIVPFETVKFSIIDADDQLIDSGNLFPINGEFSTDIFLSTVNPSYGVYQILVEYSDQSTTTTFDVIESLDDDSSSELLKSSLVLNIARSDFHEDTKGDCDTCTKIIENPSAEFLPNQYIYLSGYIENFKTNVASLPSAYYAFVDFSFKTFDGTPITFLGKFDENDNAELTDQYFSTSAVIDASGKFDVTMQLPPTLFSEGDYIVEGRFGSIVETQIFSIVSEKSTLTESEMPVSDSKVKTIIEKTNRVSDSLISIPTQEKTVEEQFVKPRVVSGSMVTIDKNNQSYVNLQVTSESGVCIIGSNSDCLITESTRKPGQIFEVVQVDGLSLNVRYSGPDVRLEKFSILPESSDTFLPDTNWNVEILKDDEITRFYYKVTYKTLE